MTLPQIREGTTLLNFYRQLLLGSPIVNGKMLDCDFAVADGTSKSFAHGLGRTYKGAFPVGSSFIGTSIVYASLPEEFAESRTHVRMSINPAATGTIRVWIY